MTDGHQRVIFKLIYGNISCLRPRTMRYTVYMFSHFQWHVDITTQWPFRHDGHLVIIAESKRAGLIVDTVTEVPAIVAANSQTLPRQRWYSVIQNTRSITHYTGAWNAFKEHNNREITQLEVWLDNTMDNISKNFPLMLMNPEDAKWVSVCWQLVIYVKYAQITSI